jgi:hypothetical protein
LQLAFRTGHGSFITIEKCNGIFFLPFKKKEAPRMPEHTTLNLYIKKIIYRATHWETWHWLAKYIPMVPYWIAYCLKARSAWFFTAANPTLTFGGYEGESKMEMYALLPDGSYPRTTFISTSFSFSEVEQLVQHLGLSFPVAVKPDVGRMGLMFRKINSLQQLREYHHKMRVDYLLQDYVLYPIEVSVFYYRRPNKSKGTITGFVRKEGLSVTGDGTSTLLELMNDYPRVWFRMEEMKIKHADNLNEIIPAGDTYLLSNALNLSRGGKLVSLEHEKDESLLDLFDQLSHHANFFFGRYDIKCASITDLKRGKNFSILEFNGSGAEPHHVYGNGNSLFQAIRILLEHWRILYEISAANREKGIPYWNFKRGLQHLMNAKVHFKILRQLERDTATFFNRTRNSEKNILTGSQKILSGESIGKVNTNATV